MALLQSGPRENRAWLAEQETGQRCYGGVALNRAVGGLNPEAIRRMVTFTGGRGKVVWLPTFDAENHVRRFGETRPSIPVVRDGRPVPELGEIFALVARHDLVLETGHSSPEESLVLIRAARPRKSGARSWKSFRKATVAINVQSVSIAKAEYIAPGG